MSEYLDNLIFDRTQADIDNMTAKAYIDYNDLNRIESVVKWVSYVLNRKGYKNTTNNKLNWQPNDFRTEADMIPLTPIRITYTSIYQANAIERIIYDLGTLIEKASPGLNHLSFRLGTRSLGNREVSL